MEKYGTARQVTDGKIWYSQAGHRWKNMVQQGRSHMEYGTARQVRWKNMVQPGRSQMKKYGTARQVRWKNMVQPGRSDEKIWYSQAGHRSKIWAHALSMLDN